MGGLVDGGADGSASEMDDEECSYAFGEEFLGEGWGVCFSSSGGWCGTKGRCLFVFVFVQLLLLLYGEGGWREVGFGSGGWIGGRMEFWFGKDLKGGCSVRAWDGEEYNW